MIDIVKRFKRKLTKLRLKPIRVFCAHDVSDVFKPDTTWMEDWMGTEEFKNRILELKRHYTFISLEEAHRHIGHDVFRLRNYCCLTFDDGLASNKEIIPWLANLGIPVTLFVNPSFLKGETMREKQMKLLTEDELMCLLHDFPSLMVIGSHGYYHEDCTALSLQAFASVVNRGEDFLKNFPHKIAFFAYPCDLHNVQTDEYLHSCSLIPVYCDGGVNYNDPSVIHRELL